MDDYIRFHFEDHVQKALKGEYDHWTKSVHGTLAIIILLDQFTRNIYRYTKDAWAGDEKALKISLEAIDKGFDKQLKPVPRAMLYMPLMHAEDNELSKKSMELFTSLHEEAKISRSLSEQVLERFKKAAIRHYNVISLFGRYPERNKYLGRSSLPEEKAYLDG